MYENDIQRIIAAVLRTARVHVPGKVEGQPDSIDELAHEIVASIEVEGFAFRRRSHAHRA